MDYCIKKARGYNSNDSSSCYYCHIFNPFGRFSSLTDSPGRPIMTRSVMKLLVGLRSFAGLRI